MRRLLWVCLLVLAGTASCHAANADEANLALSRPFTSSDGLLPGWTGLVDGNHDLDSGPACYATSNEADFPKHVTIDLGGIASISKVVVYNSANGNTRTVAISASTDGVTFRKLRDPDFIFPDRTDSVLSVSFQPRPARYVRVTFADTWGSGLGGDNCMFLREVEVLGEAGDTPPAPAAGNVAPVGAPYESARVVDIFRRYCLQREGDLNIAVVGDFTVTDADLPGHWATVAADALRKLYPDKRLTLEVVGGKSGGISVGVDWADLQSPAVAPDLILVSYGGQAAAAKADLNEFRGKYQTLLQRLLRNTASLVVVVTPPPTLPPDASGGRDRPTGPYSWVVEQTAMTLGVPLVRTAAALGTMPAPARTDMYISSEGLGNRAHIALGMAIAALLR